MNVPIPKKKKYKAPKLIVYGDIRNLTQQGGNSAADNFGGSQAMTR